MYRVLGLCCLALVTTSPCLASVVMMKNGDRITGTVKQIWGDDVFVEPSYADEYRIDKSEVAYIIDDREMTAETEDGKKLVGKMGINAAGKQVMFVDGEEVRVPLRTLSELEEPEKYSDWEMRFDVSAAANRGNTDSESLKMTYYGMYKLDKHRHMLDLLSDSQSQDDVTVKDRDYAQYNYNYDIGDPWFSAISASYEHDPIKNQEYRANIVPALGYNIFDDPGRLFIVQAGAGYQVEESIDQSQPGSVDDGGGVAAFLMRFSWDFGSPDVELFLTNTTTKAFYGRKNLSTQWATGFRFEITDFLYLNAEFDYNEESKPLDGAQPDDLALLFGFGMEFDK